VIHLICGPIGAGKTTVAHEVAIKHNAIRFSEDEWLSRLFVPDAPEGLLDEPMNVVGAWASEKYLRCRGQIWAVCKQLLNQNVNIVLDGAAANKEQRDVIRKKASYNNVGFQLYYVNASSDIRRKRILDRNTEKNFTYSLEVTSAMFEYMENFFQPPVSDELEGAIIINT